MSGGDRRGMACRPEPFFCRCCDIGCNITYLKGAGLAMEIAENISGFQPHNDHFQVYRPANIDMK